MTPSKGFDDDLSTTSFDKSIFKIVFSLMFCVLLSKLATRDIIPMNTKTITKKDKRIPISVENIFLMNFFILCILIYKIISIKTYNYARHNIFIQM